MKEIKVIKKAKETTTVRVTYETKDLIKTFGTIGDDYDDGIQNMHKELLRQIEVNKQLKKKPKKK